MPQTKGSNAAAQAPTAAAGSITRNPPTGIRDVGGRTIATGMTLRALLIAHDVSAEYGDAPDTLLAPGTTSDKVGEIAAGGGIVLHELTAQRGSLEDAYMQLTGDAVEYQTDFGNQALATAGK